MKLPAYAPRYVWREVVLAAKFWLVRLLVINIQLFRNWDTQLSSSSGKREGRCRWHCGRQNLMRRLKKGCGILAQLWKRTGIVYASLVTKIFNASLTKLCVPLSGKDLQVNLSRFTLPKILDLEIREIVWINSNSLNLWSVQRAKKTSSHQRIIQHFPLNLIQFIKWKSNLINLILTRKS